MRASPEEGESAAGVSALDRLRAAWRDRHAPSLLLAAVGMGLVVGVAMFLWLLARGGNTAAGLLGLLSLAAAALALSSYRFGSVRSVYRILSLRKAETVDEMDMKAEQKPSGARREYILPAPPRRKVPRRALLTLLAAILLLGGWLRFDGLNWDDGHHLHPDERFLTMVEAALQWPKSFSEYLDESRSPLNARNKNYGFFVYGTLPTTLVKGVSILVDRQGYDQVHLVGRVVSGALDLGTLILLFLLVRALYRDERMALIAAFLYAAMVLPIQHAHFFVVDPHAIFFMTGALYFLARVQRRGRLRDYALSGLFFGLAMACKVSVFTFALVAAIVGAYRVWHVWDTRRDSGLAARAGAKTFLLLVLMAGVAFAVFRVAQPDAFRGPGLFDIEWSERKFAEKILSKRWLGNMEEARRGMTGESDAPFGIQWANRPALWFPWKNMVLWGMGPLLGVAAWLGWLLAGWQLARRRAGWHLIAFSWVAVLFLHQGTQWVKSMRYLLPIYPCLALLAAWLLVAFWDWAGARRSGETDRPRLFWRRLAAGGAAALVLAGTAFWAFAFTSIYRRPHSRVAASEWLYDNVPTGSALANEHWDDALPGRSKGRDPFGNMYRGIQMQWYNNDDQTKLKQAIGWLDQTDYIILSSNRLYDSIPRLPTRYPMTIRYYNALFDGSLGFDRVADFTSYPRLFGIEIPDQGAEEAFHVYDHPRVQVFKKRTEADGAGKPYDREKAFQILASVDFDAILPLTALQASNAPNALMLPSERLEAYQKAGTWSRIFQRGSFSNRHPVLVWIVLLEVLGLIAFPYLFLATPNLPDRGFAFAKTLGMLLTGWLIWILASVEWSSFTRGTIAGVMLLWACGAAVLTLWRRSDLAVFFARRWGVVIVETTLFWGAFLLFLFIRWRNPDLWHPSMGGEKPMELAYLNAVIRSPYFPPYDPWYAGGYLNYYYFGFVLVASLIKLTGILPTVAFNLTIPAFFAMTALGAFGVTLALVSRRGDERRMRSREIRWGLLGAVFAVIAGNLGEVRLLLEGFSKLSKLPAKVGAGAFLSRAWDGFSTLLATGLQQLRAGEKGLFQFDWWHQNLHFRQEWWYWNATRAIRHASGEAPPITEFPFFTFLYSDLHPHLMALPLALLALGLMLAFARSARRKAGTGGAAAMAVGHASTRRAECPRSAFVSRIGGWLWMGLAALAIGALWPTNPWDFPTYASLLLFALVAREWSCDGGRFTLRGLRDAVCLWGAVIILGAALFLPYRQWYGAGISGFEAWKGTRTPLLDYLIIHGLFVFIILFALVTDFRFGPGHNGVVRLLRMAWRRIWRLDRLVRLALLHRALVRPGFSYILGFPCLVLALLIGAGLIWLGHAPPGLAFWILTGAVLLALRRRPDPPWQLALGFAATGLALTIFVEFWVLRGRDISRMNTVFKFYLQAWVLFSVASAAGIARIRQVLPRRAWFSKTLWIGGFSLLFAGTMLYPLLATRARLYDRFDNAVGSTLDGAAFLDKAEIHEEGQRVRLAWDKDAIQWLLDNVEGSPVIAEGNTRLYGWGNRFAMFTGLPAVAGWEWHQMQQRAAIGHDVVKRRRRELQRIYETPEPRDAHRILARYRAKYVIVGPLERIHYPASGLRKFEAGNEEFWKTVYDSGKVRILEVVEADESSVRGAVVAVQQQSIDLPPPADDVLSPAPRPTPPPPPSDFKPFLPKKVDRPFLPPGVEERMEKEKLEKEEPASNQEPAAERGD
ncbi:MAG TPA: DUF2298 domain-containing protein [Sumerlaeia bacterium]|nr:DUF2298 domain-containing protein [Sumerlaeia bacterium]